METKVFRTNLNCQNCVSAAAPFLDTDKAVEHWSVNTGDDRKLLSVTGPRIDDDHIRAIVGKAGFDVFEAVQLAPVEPLSDSLGRSEISVPSVKTYLPLIVIFSYLTGLVTLLQVRAGHFNAPLAMNDFMGGFFLIFSFFKLLDIAGFASAFRSYDIIAKRVTVYGYLYPFIELGLGLCYFMRVAPFATNIVNFSVMSIGAVGVLRSLVNKTRIRCACLGAVFNLPMSQVTLVEDLLMVVMSGVMIVMAA